MVLDNGEIEAIEEVRRERSAQLERTRVEQLPSVRFKRFCQHVMQVVNLYPSPRDVYRLAHRDNQKIRANEARIGEYEELIIPHSANSSPTDIKDHTPVEFRQRTKEQQAQRDLIKTTTKTADDISGDIRYKITMPIGGFARIDIDNDHDD